MAKSHQSRHFTLTKSRTSTHSVRKKKSQSRQTQGKIFRPRMSTRFKDFDFQEIPENMSLLEPSRDHLVFMKRWVALGFFCALSCCQSCIWNTWGPIAKSTLHAFPSWNSTTIALLSNWGCITYLTCCLPCCWLLNEKDLSIPIKLSAVFSTLAAFLRCLSSIELIFTITAHLAAILNGLSGVILGPATALVSAVWFPIGERTTATGISLTFSQLGMAISYWLGSFLIDNDSTHVKRGSEDTQKVKESDNSTHASVHDVPTDLQAHLRVQIMSYMRIELVGQCLVAIGIVWLLPKQSEIASSHSNNISALGIFESIKKLVRHKAVWFLCLAAAFSQGMTGPWLAMITMAFDSAITEDEADKIAFWSVIVSSILSLSASRIMDIFQGHLKVSIIVLLVISSTMFLWIVLLELKILIFHKDEIYIAVIFGIASCWSTPALFLELASEIAFPVSEAIVCGYMIFLTNVVSAFFYFMFSIPGMSGLWATCLVFGNLVLSTILMIALREEYNRTKRESRI